MLTSVVAAKSNRSSYVSSAVRKQDILFCGKTVALYEVNKLFHKGCFIDKAQSQNGKEVMMIMMITVTSYLVEQSICHFKNGLKKV